MAYMLFALFIAAPLVLLGMNLGRGAASLTRTARTAGPAARRPRRVKVNWPTRPRRVTPAVDQGRSLSPLAAFRRWRQRPQRARVAARPAPTVAQKETTRGRATAPVAKPVVLPVTASATGFRPAPASAFAAGPALTPRREQEHVVTV